MNAERGRWWAHVEFKRISELKKPPTTAKMKPAYRTQSSSEFCLSFKSARAFGGRGVRGARVTQRLMNVLITTNSNAGRVGGRGRAKFYIPWTKAHVACAETMGRHSATQLLRLATRKIRR